MSREISARSSGWGVLAAEVFDDDDRVVVRLEVPGMETDNLDIEVIDDYLVVRGEKRIAREHTSGQYHVTECAYGQFERAIPLPEAVDTDNADATYRNGVLRVELNKASAKLQRKITVKVD
jgi:HSP20 family protein